MKFCYKCGGQNEDTVKFCMHCGADLSAVNGGESYNNGQTYNNGESYNYGQMYSGQAGQTGQQYGGTGMEYGTPAGNGHPGIEPRNIVVAILLSFVTCGIYGIYWMIKLNDEINELVGDTQAPSGGMVFLFSLITCGIYSWYWLYKMGEKCDQIKGTEANSGILYLILAILQLSIVDYCLIQDTINKAI